VPRLNDSTRLSVYYGMSKQVLAQAQEFRRSHDLERVRGPNGSENGVQNMQNEMKNHNNHPRERLKLSVAFLEMGRLLLPFRLSSLSPVTAELLPC